MAHVLRATTSTSSQPVRAATAIPARAGASVHAAGVGRRFETAHGPVDACRDVDLDVSAGSFTVIVGPSGCGKSTFLRLVAGLDRPTSGDLAITSPSGATPTNAMVFQGRSLFPWLTLRQNVAYGLKLSGMSRKERGERADDLLAVVGLAAFRKAYPHQISEGMRQRVAIARALAVDPDILLMDEPFGALDEQTRFLLQEELLRIWEASRKTVLFVTHSIDEAIVLADRIVVMSAQPGTIRAALDVPFSRPRSIADVRSDPAFAELFNEIWSTLREEVNAARRAQEASLAR
ncbi:MAG TPA: ABC transporter ATP-binding protein [Thermomicrobiales bacterium]|nr:ABC transporter ATP-binding protein [Thermomicrobiales bacterium]